MDGGKDLSLELCGSEFRDMRYEVVSKQDRTKFNTVKLLVKVRMRKQISES